MPAKVNIKWDIFRMDGNANWREVKEKILEEYDAAIMARAVYVLRLCGPFAIQYENTASPVLYIGRGKIQQRVTSHLTWIHALAERIKEMKFELWLCQPRVRNAPYAYADFEAELLNRFYKKFGCLPMFNRRLESAKRSRRYSPAKAITACIGLGSGRAYHWALTPLPANSGYERYSTGPVDVRYKLRAMLEEHLAV